MNGRRFLDSRSGRIRRASAVVYAVATGVAVAVWIVSGGWDALGMSDWIGAAWLGITAMTAWWSSLASAFASFAGSTTPRARFGS